MKKIILSVILVLALTSYAYGLGRHHHHRGSSGAGGTQSVGTLEIVDVPDDNFVSVPEPVTVILLGTGLIGLAAGLARKKFKK